MKPLTIFSFVLLTGCQTSIDYSGMESAEERFNRAQSQRLCAFMSEETMFPDPQSRALAKAARKGKLLKIDQLVAEGVDANSVGARNCSALFWAMQNEAGFKRLLELGANPNIVFDDGGSVMHWAARLENSRLLVLALNFGGDPNLYAGGDTPIFEAISTHDEKYQTLSALIEAGANLNTIGKYGNTPMLSATVLGRFDAVIILLESGADPSVQDKFGFTLQDRVQARLEVLEPGSEYERRARKVYESLTKDSPEL